MIERKNTMASLSLDTPVGQLVTARPSRSLAFERLGIDYCCGGKRPLRDACAGKGLDPEQVLHELEVSDQKGAAEDEVDWSKAPLSALADYIVTTHHDTLRKALPRLELLIGKVARAHGERHPELRELWRVFGSFQSDLELHMLKEERVLFPMCRQLDTARTPPESHCGSINNPILVMTLEHEHAGSDLAAMRALTGDFTPPADACVTYRVMLDGLTDLERDMHRHVHLENNILFPRAAAMAARLAEHKGLAADALSND
jgi:regulator of cell morphogenesis and NO signaling